MKKDKKDDASITKQIIFIRADQLLNITITKTGLDLVQRLSTLFSEVYNKRLTFTDDDDDQPMLSLFNGIGQQILIEHLDGLEVNSKHIFIFILFSNIFLNLSLLINIYHHPHHHHHQLY